MEALNPGRNCGCARVRPKVVLRAISGFRAGLPTVSPSTLKGDPLKRTVVLVTTGAANNSLKLGARMSRDVTARKLRPSIGVFQVPPTFQAVTFPEVLYLVCRTARFRFASPTEADFSNGRFCSR